MQKKTQTKQNTKHETPHNKQKPYEAMLKEMKGKL